MRYFRAEHRVTRVMCLHWLGDFCNYVYMPQEYGTQVSCLLVQTVFPDEGNLDDTWARLNGVKEACRPCLCTSVEGCSSKETLSYNVLTMPHLVPTKTAVHMTSLSSTSRARALSSIPLAVL